MREKIKTPVVIINKRETSDSYVVSVTDGSNNFHDGVLLVGVKPVEKNDRFAVFSMAGYYMAAEIERLRRRIDELESKSKFHVLPELGSHEINEAAWSLYNSLVANGPINASQFNNLKTSFYEALKVAVASNIEKTV
ncbi:hypothetical protein ABML54_003666 [Salmonella enterica subsp. enterica serovar Newport]|nr:hypothetical protein [Salmonella enterica subsp. enterica serovar Newport]EDM3691335.1 hypothetical protein [Salmonella enterica subsp. enterica serovar Infantis]EGC2933276.1 hypothetical protein [Salmonella enterica subsp. enterica serovar Newport]EJU2882536.1 hypothetical protein [Salmonella enterica subsp. enterica serovar Newport]